MYLLIIFLALNWAYQKYFGTEDSDNAAETGGGTYVETQLLSTTPHEAVRKVYKHVAQGRADLGCGRFTASAARQFANNFDEPNCTAAIKQLSTEVENMNAYAEPWFPNSAYRTPSGDHTTISSCEMTVEGGPSLGVFTLKQVEKGQWIVDRHEQEPNPCPPPPSEDVPTPPAAPTG
ncbi:hypothetical protein EV191_105246 [Tamaricihabitans halophyticus]|uniref:Uncharacterized protein n=1 Tax=Tamaricihabitans halophyticus TaxID=1262583 RepID=A0A4R2QVQ6_9PSEU|nr:hypothetical protein EV191_105246 [Tamaricihabitans halophyticus]